jgi:hypothetical protein
MATSSGESMALAAIAGKAAPMRWFRVALPPPDCLVLLRFGAIFLR